MKVKIGDLTKIKTGKLDANASSEDGQYPFFTCSKEPLKISTYSYDCECVLVAGNGDLNVKYYKGKFDAYQRTYIIEDNGSGKLYMPYLYYFMEDYIEELRKQAIGGVIKYIKLGNLTDALIELPPVDEQKFIAEILKRTKGILDKRNHEICAFDNLIKARFIEMFGDVSANEKQWYSCTLSEKSTIGSSKRIFAKEYVPTGVPFYRSKEIIELGKGFQPSVELFISQERYAEIKEKYGVPQIGDILMTAVGTIGKFWTVETEAPFYYKDGNIVYIRVNGFNTVFFRALLEMLIEVYKQDAANGSAYAALPIEKLKAMRIVVPPIELQEHYAEFLKQINKSKVAF